MAVPYNFKHTFAWGLLRAGEWKDAEEMFQELAEENNPHAIVSLIYIKFLKGEVTPKKVKKAVKKYRIKNSPHGDEILRLIEE